MAQRETDDEGQFWIKTDSSVCTIKSYSLHTSQVAHQAGVYPGFCSMKRLGVFVLLPRWDASPSQGEHVGIIFVT